MKLKSTPYAAWLLGGLCALATVSCSGKKDPAPELVQVSYAQTYCADRWGQAASTQQLVAVAQTYLAQQGLTLKQPQASVQREGELCKACTCKTGIVLEGTVSVADLPAVLALGFTKQ